MSGPTPIYCLQFVLHKLYLLVIKKSKRLSKLDTEEKIKRYEFSPDRADVIDHALHIFKFIAERLEIQTITSTKWGISDSIAIKLFHESRFKNI